MGRFLCDLWRVVAQMRGPIPRLRNNAEKGRPPSVLTLPSQDAFFCTAPVGGRPGRSTPLLGEALEAEMVESQVPIANVAYSCGGAPLFVLTDRTHLLGGHHPVDTQLLFKASFATSTNVRSRPRRPMKPLEELLNPPERGTQPEQSQQRDAQPDTPAASTTGATAPNAALPSGARETPTQKPSQRRFGVVSPQELPSGSSWVGRNGGPDRRTGRNGQGSVNQQESLNGGRTRAASTGDLWDGSKAAVEKKRTGFADSSGGRARGASTIDLWDDKRPVAERKRTGMTDSAQRRSEPGPNRVSFAQILKSSKAPPQYPASETPGKVAPAQEKKKAIPIPEEDPEDINSIPLRAAAAPRAIPSWKVGLANREKRAAKAAAKDGEQRVNEAITAATVRLVDPEGGSHEVVSIGEALDRARKAGLDVVEVNARSDPPVCKLVDYKKFKFENKKKEKDRKKQELEQRREKIVKEIRLSSRTDYRDMEMKARTAKEHLALGYQVRCFLQFKKGDRRADIGHQLLPEMLKLLESHGTVNKPPREAGGRLEMYLRPLSLAERKKLPEYKKEAGPESAPETSKKRKATVVVSEEEGLVAETEDGGETEGDLAAESEEEWAEEEAEEDESDTDEEEPLEEVEGTDGEEEAWESRLESELEKIEFEEYDEEPGRNEGDEEEEEEVVIASEDGRTDEGTGVQETSDRGEELEGGNEFADGTENELDEADLMAEFLREDFRKLDAEEESKSASSPKRKRWADRLRRPLRPKQSRKRRQADEDSDDEDDVPLRRAFDLDNEEYDGTKPSRKRRQADEDSDDEDDVRVQRAFDLDNEEYDSSGSGSDSDSNKDKSRHRRRR